MSSVRRMGHAPVMSWWGRMADERTHADLVAMAVELVTETASISVSWVQRHLRVGHGEAVRVVASLEDAGLVGPADWMGRRDVLVGPHGG